LISPQEQVGAIPTNWPLDIDLNDESIETGDLNNAGNPTPEAMWPIV